MDENLYISACTLCHGLKGEGKIGLPLAGGVEKFKKMRLTEEQIQGILAGFPTLVRNGIPGRMPGNPHMTDGEVESLRDYLLSLSAPDSWEAEFEAQHGRTPTNQDRADRDWSLDFLAKNGHAPTEADWIAHWKQTSKK